MNTRFAAWGRPRRTHFEQVKLRASADPADLPELRGVAS
jgi:hypothetical protein